MEIILLKDVEKVGSRHEVVTVKNGFGRNYLIPQGLAVIANPTNMKKLESLKTEEEARENAKIEEYKAILDKIKDVTLKIGVKAGASGKIFGSVNTIQLAQALKDQVDVEVEKKNIELPEEVKELGSYTAKLILHKEVTGNVQFELIEE
ncbi:MAG TPA: 50S ribosomal protein L9 [Saprospiraceae bacterium]|nr:50S ribosomal protein L9 [Saprospiraceae bacterium]